MRKKSPQKFYSQQSKIEKNPTNYQFIKGKSICHILLTNNTMERTVYFYNVDEYQIILLKEESQTKKANTHDVIHYIKLWEISTNLQQQKAEQWLPGI